MGLAFWRTYHEQQAARQAAAVSPLQALEAPKEAEPPKAESKPVEATTAPSPSPSPTPEPSPKAAPKTERERVVTKLRERSVSRTRRPESGS